METRKKLRELFKDANLSFAVVEMPPGPPVLQSVVAEVHNQDGEIRRAVAADLTKVFQAAPNLVDVDNYMREPHDYWRFVVDRDKADERGISVETINKNLAMALGGMVLGDVKQHAGHEPVNIVIQVPLAVRSQVSRLGDILIQSPTGVTVPLRELGKFVKVPEDPLIYHKDLRAVEYVVADVGGKYAAPVYGMIEVEDLLAKWNDGKPYVTPDNVKLVDETYWTGPPPNDAHSAIEWTGEWTVTYETFRDMGIAFAAALVMIYILVVWEFGNFRIPALIMAPIPLTLLGIVPAHAIFFANGWGGEFTATSMIGWIALAGIIVRNSILLVDFSIHEVQRGVPVAEAVIQACKTRTRPILITAFALVFASTVIFFDPIFQGMAISLASGVLVSTLLTLVVIPLGCVMASKSLCEVAGRKCGPQGGGAAGKAKQGPSLLKRTWHLLVTLLVGLFGLVAMLFRLVKDRRLRKPEPEARREEPPAPPGAERAEPVKPAPAAAAARTVSEGKPVRADKAKPEAVQVPVEEVPEPAGKTLGQPPVEKKADMDALLASLEEKVPTGKAYLKETTDRVEYPVDSLASAEDLDLISRPLEKGTGGLAREEKGETPVSQSTRAEPKAARKKVAKKTVKKKVASSAKSAAKKTVAKKKTKATPAVKKAAAKKTGTNGGRKGGRRGIRLKSLDSDDGLS